MHLQINQLVKSLLQKDTLEQCSVQELQQYADRHPYFGAAQLLLTKKLQVENSELYDEQLQKTFLFFHNPLWVEHLLNDTGEASIIQAKTTEPSVIPVIIEAEHVTEVKIAEEPTTVPEEIIEEPVSISEPVAVVAETRQSTNGKEDHPVIMPDLKIEPAAPGNTDMLFQPYHTVDYFASQGIKFKEEEKPKDRFGQQLKSFTDWLKTMKRLPATEIPANLNPGNEDKVEKLAEHSIEDREILTETMAEVWEKQGNPVKAIEIYHKLSLLDPPKSAYFAAKIEELKKLN
jgi:hypothetical protein